MSAFGTNDPLHVESRACGLFVVGEGNCIEVASMEQARQLIAKLKSEKKQTDQKS